MGRELEDEGYRVFTAHNGRQALEVVARQQLDLIVTDLLMPEMDGAELIRALASDGAAMAIPVLVMSIVRSDGAPLQGLPIAGHIRKPFPIEAFLQFVRRVAAANGG